MRRISIVLAVILGCLVVALPANAGRKIVPTSTMTLLSGRTYLLHDNAPATTPHPLIVALHGLDGSPAVFEKNTGLSTFADNHGATVVYGQALVTNGHRSWNAGACCQGADQDDVAYIDQIVADVEARTLISRVYVWGWSNGGMMAWRLVCQQPDLFAAAGVMSGALVPGDQFDCSQTVVHVRHLHGVQDTIVPEAGGYRAYCPCDYPATDLESSEVGVGSVVSQKLDLPCGHLWATSADACRFWADGDLWSFSQAQ